MSDRSDEPLEELSTPALIDRIGTRHDYLWARLPFVVPMAGKLARQCGSGSPACSRLAELVTELRSLLLDHLHHEESELAELAETRDPAAIEERLDDLRAEHLAVGDLLRRIRAAAGLHRAVSPNMCATERALYSELDRLEHHVRSQVLLEETVLAPRLERKVTP